VKSLSQDSSVCVHCGKPITEGTNVWRYGKSDTWAHLACVSQINHDLVDQSIYDRIHRSRYA